MPKLVLNLRELARVRASVRYLRRPRNGFGAARAGNVSIVFAVSLVPMIGLVGLGADYGIALSDKAKLDNAADSAVLAAVATAKAYIATNAASQTDPTLTNNAIAAGLDRGKRAFTVNTGSLPFAAAPTSTLTLNRVKQTFIAKTNYQTTSTNSFGRMFGQQTTIIKGSTSAQADIPSYIDFYLLIDVSGSMGLPATSDGQSAMMSGVGCQFACHFNNAAKNTVGWNYAVSHSIQLRSGAVNTAVCSLLSQAAQPLVPKQYRVGLYPFIAQMATLAGITSDIASLKVAATCNSSPPTKFTDLLDTGVTQLATNNDPSTGLGSGGTHLTAVFSSMQSTINTYGDGSSAQKPKPFVFLITDGMNNSQNYGVQQNGTWNWPGYPSSYSGYPSASWVGGSNPQNLDPSYCTSLKNAGATISILYIPYNILTLGSTDQGETNAANSVSPKIPTSLTNCASSGFFNQANTPADINTALQAMFAQALQAAHLTN